MQMVFTMSISILIDLFVKSLYEITAYVRSYISTMF